MLKKEIRTSSMIRASKIGANVNYSAKKKKAFSLLFSSFFQQLGMAA